MIIDFHTHAFPDRIYEKTIKILEGNIVKYSNIEMKAIGSGNIGGLRGDIKNYGIDYSVVLPIATAPKQTESIITFADAINKNESNIVSFASLHPENKNPKEIIERIYFMGFKGIKLHPDYQNFYIDSPESIKILKLCEKYGLLVVLHTGHDHGCAPPRHCTPERLSHLTDELSCANIICAHMGGWKMWEEAEEYIIGKPFMIDTSFALHLMDNKTASRFVNKHGAGKVLFGTDWPWYSPVETIEMVNSLDLSDGEKDMIFSGNAKRLLGL